LLGKNKNFLTLDFIRLMIVKTKQFRSILAVTVVAASITTSLAPAQAFTWDDFWQSFKQGLENSPSLNSPQQSEGSNETPQAAPLQNNYTEPSSPTTSPRLMTGRPSVINCVKANGSDIRGIGRDDPESMVSVGRRAIKVYGKVVIYTGEPYGETCSIQVHPSSEKVALAFAIPDNSSLYNVRVSIYVDGQERISKIMSRGEFRKYIFDVTSASSYAYTLEPLDRINGDIYFPQISQPR
jgi:hypothetical protein